jgi:penicillin-binding protein 2
VKQRSDSQRYFERLKRRLAIFGIGAVIGFSVISLRLWQLQVAQYETLKNRSENNRIRQVALDGLRGSITDRNGKLLVDNRPSFELSIIPKNVPDLDATFLVLSEKVPIDIPEAREVIKQSRSFDRVVIKRDITREEVAFVQERRYRLPGVFLDIRPIRRYLYHDSAAHLIGYLGAITPDELEAAQPSVYSRTDFTGRFGVEKAFEPILRGGKGFKIVEVDATGREMAELDNYPAKQGGRLPLALDIETQKAAEHAMGDRKGAIIALDPATGEILAFVSSPSFDPNRFAFGVTQERWGELVNDERHPLQNRVTQGLYPPASTFKLVVAAAALEVGIIDPHTTVHCPGYFRYGDHTYRCWNRGGHGSVNVTDALVQSCDVFFYSVGEKLGVDKIAEYAHQFGLGVEPGLAVGPERSGLIPTIEWKKRVRKEDWYPGETISCAIGQGYTLTTPMQLARMTAFIANGGQLVTPTAIHGGGHLADSYKSETTISPATLKLVQQAMRGVVHSSRGTGRRVNGNKGYEYGGKTGTAQVVVLREYAKNETIPEEFRDHALFVGYAPFDNPKIAVAVVIEHAGGGGANAAPVAGIVIDAYLEGLQQRLLRDQTVAHLATDDLKGF